MGDEHWAVVSQGTIPKDPYADGRKTTSFFSGKYKNKEWHGNLKYVPKCLQYLKSSAFSFC